MSDERLLAMRMCDLGLKIQRTVVGRRVKRLYEELERRDIMLLPHVWLSSEWFSPDGVPGIAVPFYLAHQRLTKLEDKMMLEVEGGGERQCMRILRHEAGHAICNAYRLHFKPRWRQMFGRYSQPYPDFYQPKPYSRSYVMHIDAWYAQAHPAEDFAETFAVWLAPGSRWRQRYHGWPALRKLEYVDELMHQIAGKPAPVRSRAVVEPLSSLRMTLGEYYRDKRMRYASEWPEFFDRELRMLFSDDPKFARNEQAAHFLRRIRPDVRRAVAMWTSEYQYTIDQVIQDMIDRCKELNLRLARPKREAESHAMIMVTVQTMNYLHDGHHRIAL